MHSLNRRNWLRNTFLATTGAALLPTAASGALLENWAERAHTLNEADPADEAYWELVSSMFHFEDGLRYFNNASLGPSPEMVADATNAFRRQLDAFPSKYGWYAWKPEKEVVREKMAALLQVSPEEIALTHNTTEGMNLVAHSLDLAPGDEVILANHEHHTGTIPWIYHQERKGIKLIRPKLPLTPRSGAEIVDIYRNAVTSRTKAISLVHMTNTNGMILPVKEISAMARQKGILVAVDGAQTLGMIDFNLADLGCDFYAASCHKWLYSPKGMGVFYARQESQKHLRAMIVCGGFDDPSIRRLENYNTRNLPELLGVGTALDFHALLGKERKHRRILELKHYFLDKIRGNDRFLVKTPLADDDSAGILTVEVLGRDVKELQQSLSEQHGIDCRPMTSHDLNGLRLSFSVFNLKKDIDYLVSSLVAISG